MKDLPLSQLVVKSSKYPVRHGYATFFAPANLIEQIRRLERKASARSPECPGVTHTGTD